MCIERYGNPRNRHVLTHSFPTRRASELERHAFGREQVQGRADIDDRLEAEVRDEPGDGEEHEQILLRQQPREGAHDQKCEQADDDEAEDRNHLLAGNRTDEVGMGRSKEPTYELQSLMRTQNPDVYWKKK